MEFNPHDTHMLLPLCYGFITGNGIEKHCDHNIIGYESLTVLIILLTVVTEVGVEKRPRVAVVLEECCAMAFWILGCGCAVGNVVSEEDLGLWRKGKGSKAASRGRRDGDVEVETKVVEKEETEIS